MHESDFWKVRMIPSWKQLAMLGSDAYVSLSARVYYLPIRCDTVTNETGETVYLFLLIDSLPRSAVSSSTDYTRMIRIKLFICVADVLTYISYFR